MGKIWKIKKDGIFKKLEGKRGAQKKLFQNAYVFYCKKLICLCYNKKHMDPLYDNYDKRQKALEEKSAPKPQPTLNSMPVFGAAAQKEVESDNSQKTNTEPVAPSQETVINLHENTEAASTVANSVSESAAQPAAQPAETVIQNAQPTDVLSAQPAQDLAAQPVQTPVMNQAPNMDQAPNMSQASNMNQTPNMSQVADQNLAANMSGQNPMMQPQEASFEQQFAQMVDGVKPAQLGTQQSFNPGYTGTGDIILNLDQPKKKKDPKVIALIVGVVLLVIASIALLILSGTKNNVSKKDRSKNNNDFIEYFIYGTEGENKITDETFKVDSNDYAFKLKLSTEDSRSIYKEKIIEKAKAIENGTNVVKDIELYSLLVELSDIIWSNKIDEENGIIEELSKIIEDDFVSVGAYNEIDVYLKIRSGFEEEGILSQCYDEPDVRRCLREELDGTNELENYLVTTWFFDRKADEVYNILILEVKNEK